MLRNCALRSIELSVIEDLGGSWGTALELRVGMNAAAMTVEFDTLNGTERLGNLDIARLCSDQGNNCNSRSTLLALDQG